MVTTVTTVTTWCELGKELGKSFHTQWCSVSALNPCSLRGPFQSKRMSRSQHFHGIAWSSYGTAALAPQFEVRVCRAECWAECGWGVTVMQWVFGYPRINPISCVIFVIFVISFCILRYFESFHHHACVARPRDQLARSQVRRNQRFESDNAAMTRHETPDMTSDNETQKIHRFRGLGVFCRSGKSLGGDVFEVSRP